ncbi:MAG TPA: hypothetical protein P5348_03125, partial [Bacteroidales bacterium]|nr:hypothetical protein [Bacteroidales bacterium]
MKKYFIFLLVLYSCATGEKQKERTFCNPLNLNYRFQYSADVSYREAADPTLIRYKESYILFVSHSGGYWYSGNLLDWTYLPVKTL